jgi:predicted amidophosphoribosyltransferase
MLAGGVAVLAAFEHEGAIKALIHHLKYRGVAAVAEFTAEVLVHRLPTVPLVPVPRALSRRLKYGVDPAREIASALARRLRVPVMSALGPPLHTPRRAGRDHSRSVPPFRVRRKPMTPVILVDDVVTTGATVRAAVEALGADRVRLVAAASVVPSTSNVVAA